MSCAYTAFRIIPRRGQRHIVTLEIMGYFMLPSRYMRLVRYMKRQARRYS